MENEKITDSVLMDFLRIETILLYTNTPQNIWQNPLNFDAWIDKLNKSETYNSLYEGIVHPLYYFITKFKDDRDLLVYGDHKKEIRVNLW